MTRREFAKALRKAYRRRVGELADRPEDADAVLDEAEREVGFSLPDAVRFLFASAGPDFADIEFGVSQYTDRWHPDATPDGDYWWPDRMLPVRDFGAGLWLCLDCREPAAPAYLFRDPVEQPDDEAYWPGCFEPVAGSLTAFWRGFLDGADLPRREATEG